MKKVFALLGGLVCLTVAVLYGVYLSGGMEQPRADRNVPGATTGEGRRSLTE